MHSGDSIYLKEEGLSCHIEDVHSDIMITDFHLGHAKVNTQCCHVFGHKSLFTKALDEAALKRTSTVVQFNLSIIMAL